MSMPSSFTPLVVRSPPTYSFKMLAAAARFTTRSLRIPHRALKTLSTNPHINVFDSQPSPALYTLTYLDSDPPSQELAIGTCTAIPPSPRTFSENPRFMAILQEVVTEYGHEDDNVISQARALASPGGFSLGLGGPPSSHQHVVRSLSRKKGRGGGTGETGAGGASAQGGAGGGGRRGWVHLSDERNPPDFGRIAWPEDILGSVEVDEEGRVVGRVQPSGTYRLLTNEGILGLSSFLRGKLVERLKKEEVQDKA
ncbi:hypothetical protein CDD80_2674 [Ophiocordyceps camponoti-rufipedis]|uniref:Uncharacterized protein n=1 Tax=Ophiocordyceps camponoti-rufipedis TaxID=2004952 RepID=A0A2C5YAD2_9HYPO|nr:hypothetical protein CDD80_2674 [Ophiocordyceps camponoti-rufipedis]